MVTTVKMMMGMVVALRTLAGREVSAATFLLPVGADHGFGPQRQFRIFTKRRLNGRNLFC
jgi:hypothetical protein